MSVRRTALGATLGLALLVGCSRRSREVAAGDLPPTPSVVADSLPLVPPPNFERGPEGPSELLRGLHRQADAAVFMTGFRVAVRHRDRRTLLPLMAADFKGGRATGAADRRRATLDAWDASGLWTALDSLLDLGFRTTDRGDLVFPAAWDGNPATSHGLLVSVPPTGWIWDSFVPPK